MKMKALEANSTKSSCIRKPSDQKQVLECSGVLGEPCSKPGLLLPSVTVQWVPARSRRRTSSGHRSKNIGKHLPLGQKFSLFLPVGGALKDLSDEMSEIQKTFSNDISNSIVLTACGKAHMVTVSLSVTLSPCACGCPCRRLILCSQCYTPLRIYLEVFSILLTLKPKPSGNFFRKAGYHDHWLSVK